MTLYCISNLAEARLRAEAGQLQFARAPPDRPPDRRVPIRTGCHGRSAGGFTTIARLRRRSAVSSLRISRRAGPAGRIQRSFDPRPGARSGHVDRRAPGPARRADAGLRSRPDRRHVSFVHGRARGPLSVARSDLDPRASRDDAAGPAAVSARAQRPVGLAHRR